MVFTLSLTPFFNTASAFKFLAMSVLTRQINSLVPWLFVLQVMLQVQILRNY